MSRNQLVRRLGRSEEGATALFVGLTMMTVVGAVGIAVDYGRAQLVQAKLLNAADAAGLAAGARLNSIIAANGTITSGDQAKLNAEVERFLKANFPDGYVDAKPKVISVVASADYKTLTTTVEATMPTTFMSIWGKTGLTVRALSEVTRKTGGLEVALVLDNTGSMGSNDTNGKAKLENMKTATKSLLDILYGTDDVVENLFVSVVPFSQTVNVGNEHAAWMSDFATLDWSSAWNGCVEARDGSAGGKLYDTLDSSPSTKAFRAYALRPLLNLSEKHDDHNYLKNRSDESSSYSYDQIDEKYKSLWSYYNNWIEYKCSQGQFKDSSNGVDYCPPGKLVENKLRLAESEGQGPDAPDCPVKVLPLTKSRATVQAKVMSMTAQGMTHIGLGAVWGWKTISPSWRNLWGNADSTANDLPLDYGASFMKKAVVIMTDGDNTYTSSNSYSSGYTAYRRPADKMLASNQTDAEKALDTRLSATCTNMKDKGIIVYAVSFGTVSEVTEATKTLLRNCASKSEFYWHAPSGTELKTAFEQIGESLSNLRVSR